MAQTFRPQRRITYRLLLEYDGARFAGWQFQPGRRTVQGVLERALRRLFHSSVKTVAASRTDAGVHAEAQSVSFRASRAFKGNLAAALNTRLPDDVAVLSSTVADAVFHAKRDARAKTYIYRLVNRPVRPVLGAAQKAWFARPLNVLFMRREAERLMRRRNFSDYAGRASRRRSPFCRLTSLKVGKRGDEIAFEITADRFLHRMARRIVGRLIGAGLGKSFLNSRPYTAEARGLTLRNVSY